MSQALRDETLNRLLGQEVVDEEVYDLIEKAFEGEAALEAGLSELGEERETPKKRSLRPAGPAPRAAYLKRIAVQGFRGVGPACTLELLPGPGLTLVLGRNGSGKSSFAEGLETLLSGKSRRWHGRSKEWQGGWRNLHTSTGSFVEAEFLVEGSEPVVARRLWKAEAELDDCELRVRSGGPITFEALGWAGPLATFRPFLSHDELGAVFEEPSKLHDELKSILGLETLSETIKVLQAAMKQRDGLKKEAKSSVERMRKLLLGSEDPRAEQCRAALGRTWKLDAIEAATLGHEPAPELARLQAIAHLPGPTLEAVERAVAELREALAAHQNFAGSSAETSAQLASLLTQALSCHEAFEGACPTCERPLPDDWSERARARLAQASELATQIKAAEAALQLNVRALRDLIRPVPEALRSLDELGLAQDAARAWQAWSQPPAPASELAAHAETHVLPLVVALEALRKQASERLASLEDAWRPIARQLAAWLPDARRALHAEPAVKALKKAIDWLKQTEDTFQKERFAPIATRQREVWNLLRQQSNVELADIQLEGTGTRRRLALDVTVDGLAGVALGVMSQGELNALALSLFLPRMTLAESPFRFLVIDDPVQAMDPHKVEGLVRVLEAAAKTHQVVVFTHDTRLFEAIRRLAIQATVLDVGRRAQSVLEVSVALDPVERYLADAYQCVRQTSKLGPGIAARTVPGFCRLALEAACVEAVRRRRLARGEPHVEVEAMLASIHGVHDLAALAIADDANAGEKVYGYLNNKLGRSAGDAFGQIKEASHRGYQGDLEELLRATKKIAQVLREQR